MEITDYFGKRETEKGRKWKQVLSNTQIRFAKLEKVIDYLTKVFVSLIRTDYFSTMILSTT